MNARPQTSKEAQQTIRSNMTYKEYSLSELWMDYQKVMARDIMITDFVPMKYKWFRQRLGRWSRVDGSWLIKKGHGKEAVYYKRCCHRHNKSRPAWIAEVRKSFNRRIGSWLK